MEPDRAIAAHLARASSHGWAVRAEGPSITAIARTRDARTAMVVVPLLAVFAYWLATAAADWAKRGADWSRGGLLTLLALGCVVFVSVIGMRTLGSVVVRLDADRLRVATGVGPLRRRWAEARSELRRAWGEVTCLGFMYQVE
ncbi:MAG: hypothetical protein FJ255_06690 [Phycisphaerae bacterium]|nr:hypothetical protein [Phycisphaerae bacterium]